jgi:hypothetical protein
VFYLLQKIRPIRLFCLGNPQGLRRDEAIYLKDYEALEVLESQLTSLNEPVIVYIRDLSPENFTPENLEGE